MKKILLMNGPNLNMLGIREKSVYGSNTLEDLYRKMQDVANEGNIELTFFQSNFEGELIDTIHQANNEFEGIIMNPAAFTHYSYAIADAISAVSIPLIEVHISNIYKREEFRHHSVVAPVAIGQISGLGLFGYIAALLFFIDYLNDWGVIKWIVD